MVTRQAEHGLLDCLDLAGIVMGLFGLWSRVGPYLFKLLCNNLQAYFIKRIEPEIELNLRLKAQLSQIHFQIKYILLH